VKADVAAVAERDLDGGDASPEHDQKSTHALSGRAGAGTRISLGRLLSCLYAPEPTFKNYTSNITTGCGLEGFAWNLMFTNPWSVHFVTVCQCVPWRAMDFIGSTVYV
jgi:hypothetical protein